MRLRELTAQQVQQFYAGRLAAGLSSSTVHHLHETLHKALKDAERLGLVSRNVTKMVNPPRMASAEIHPLSREEAQILLDVANGERLQALYLLALATGVRQSELLGLRWSDFDLDAQPVGLVRVRSSSSAYLQRSVRQTVSCLTVHATPARIYFLLPSCSFVFIRVHSCSLLASSPLEKRL